MTSLFVRCADCGRRVLALFNWKQGDDCVCKGCARSRAEGVAE